MSHRRGNHLHVEFVFENLHYFSAEHTPCGGRGVSNRPIHFVSGHSHPVAPVDPFRRNQIIRSSEPSQDSPDIWGLSMLALTMKRVDTDQEPLDGGGPHNTPPWTPTGVCFQVERSQMGWA
jgi:hypothetical protein